MSTYREELEQIKKLQAEAEKLRGKEIAAVVKDIKKTMTEYGITPADLGFKSSRRGKGKSVAPKYRDPVTGKTWSGRGIAPKWLGKDRDKFLIRR